MSNDESNVNFDELDNVHEEPKDSDIAINETNIKNREVLGSELPTEALIDITKKKLKIIRYKELFGKHLTHYGDRLDINKLDELTTDELCNLSEEVKITVGSRNSGGFITSVYLGIAGVAEGLGPKIGMDLENLKVCLFNNEAIKDTLQELSLEYEDLVYMPPAQRLLLLTGQTIIALNEHNKFEKKKKILNNSEIKKEILEQFSDL